MSEYMAAKIDAQIDGAISANERLLNEIEKLRKALAFYADPSRYCGPNQRLNSPDEWSERAGLQAYRLDVTRDQGVIARTALEGMQ